MCRQPLEHVGLSTIIAAGGDYQTVERIFLEIESGLADGLIAEFQHLTAEDVEALTRRLATRKPLIIFHPIVQTEPIFRVPTGCDDGDRRSASDSVLTTGIDALPICSTPHSARERA